MRRSDREQRRLIQLYLVHCIRSSFAVLYIRPTSTVLHHSSQKELSNIHSLPLLFADRTWEEFKQQEQYTTIILTIRRSVYFLINTLQYKFIQQEQLFTERRSQYQLVRLHSRTLSHIQNSQLLLMAASPARGYAFRRIVQTFFNVTTFPSMFCPTNLSCCQY